MIKERYVNLEVAKLLRDKGFLQDIDLRMTRHLAFYDNSGLRYDVDKWYDAMLLDKIPFVVAPTQQMVCDWIEEKYNISIEVYVNIIGYTVCLCYALQDPNTALNIIQDDIPDGDNPDGSWSSKELAYDNAIKYILTELV